MKKIRMRLLIAGMLMCATGLASATGIIPGPVVYGVKAGNIDGYGPGWKPGVWDLKAINSNATYVPFKGDKSIALDVGKAWGGISFTPEGGFNTTGYTNISLAIRNAVGVQDLYFYVIDDNGQKSPNIVLREHVDTWTLPPWQWKWVRVPIKLLNLSTPIIRSINIETSQPSKFYLDEIRLDRWVVLYEGVRKQRGPTNMFQSWGGEVNQFYLTDLSNPDTGNRVLLSNFSQAWGGVQFDVHWHSVFWSHEYKSLVLWVATFNEGQNVYAYILNADTGEPLVDGDGNIISVRLADYLPTKKHTVKKWEKVIIPMVDLIKGCGKTSVRIGSLAMENQIPGFVAWDNIVFVKW